MLNNPLALVFLFYYFLECIKISPYYVKKCNCVKFFASAACAKYTKHISDNPVGEWKARDWFVNQVYFQKQTVFYGHVLEISFNLQTQKMSQNRNSYKTTLQINKLSRQWFQKTKNILFLFFNSSLHTFVLIFIVVS